VNEQAILPVDGCPRDALDALLAATISGAVPTAAPDHSPARPLPGPHAGADGQGATFAFPPGYSPSATCTLWECGANARHNRYARARITKQIRLDVARLANHQRTPHFTGPVAILAVQHPPKGRRGLDAENTAPLVKAAIDGLRDANVLINDSAKWVPAVSYTTGERVPRGQLVLHIQPVGGTTP